jgi:hypothetical protein
MRRVMLDARISSFVVRRSEPLKILVGLNKEKILTKIIGNPERRTTNYKRREEGLESLMFVATLFFAKLLRDSTRFHG